MTSKQYIGDGVYVEYDGFNLILTTEDGISSTSMIYLAPAVYDALTTYVSKILPPKP